MGDLPTGGNEADWKFIQESNLDFRYFHCCGDEDLYPFGCPRCGRLMVLCYECDTLYEDLGELVKERIKINYLVSSQPGFFCPSCGFSFDPFLVRDRLYQVTREAWQGAGLGQLLRIDPAA